MPRSIRALATVALASLALARSPALAEEDWAVQANRETSEVLRAVIADEVKTVEPCTFSDRWTDGQPIDSERARKYLGLTLRADVTAPDDGRSVVDVFAPNEAMEKSFCDDELFEQRRKRLFDDFTAGRTEGEPGTSESERRVRAQRVRFGRPVFDAEFRTAALFVDFTVFAARKDPERQKKYPQYYTASGLSIGSGVAGSGMFYAYRKIAGSWVRIASEQISILD